MKKLLLSVLVVLGFVLPLSPAAANEGGYPWDSFPRTKMTDEAALQNGARIFANYCLGCHSATYMRYNRLHDIGLSDDQIKKNLLFAADKVGDTMKAALDPRQAKDLFGTAPPDLSVIARSRAEVGKGSGADYLGPEMNGDTYRFKFMQNGRVIWVDVDGQGRVVRRSRDR